jgi:FkbM family methyltransferase
MFFLKLSKLFGNKREKLVDKWFLEDGDNKYLLNHPLLNGDSIIFEVGGYKGRWVSDIFSKYLSKIYVFEPINEFYEIIYQRFKKNKNIRVFNFGLAGRTRNEVFCLLDDRSSIKGKRGIKRKVILKDIISFVQSEKIKNIDLMQINIEGGEYELLEKIIDSGLIDKIKELQIQFHNIEKGSSIKMKGLQKKMSKTHLLKFQYLFVWEGWIRK